MLFSKSPVPGEDLQRFTQIAARRRKMIDAASNEPIPATYAVNELSAALHPGAVPAKIAEIIEKSPDCKTFVLQSCSKNGRFPYFRAGQYITLTAKLGESLVTRPYSLCSSPLEALNGRYEVTVRKAGLFSSWLCEQAVVGTELLVGEPSGDFYHDDLRDRDTIVAIAGGSGVTPFISMIKAICEKSEDFKLILLYGAATRADMLVKPNDVNDERIKIVPVLSEEQSEECEHGFITADIISRYAPEEASYFLCGPDAMYDFVGKELEKLGAPAYRTRREHNAIGNRKIEAPRDFTLTVHMRDKVYIIPAREEETLLVAMERAGLAAPSRCRAGICGFCHSKLIEGNYTVPHEYEARRLADFKFGFIHPCCTYPDSDMEIDVPLNTVTER